MNRMEKEKAKRMRKGKSRRHTKGGKKAKAMRILPAAGICILAIISLFLMIGRIRDSFDRADPPQAVQEYQGQIPRPELDVELLTVNEYSRPGIALPEVNGIVIHYTANPGTSAIANRDYFEGLKDSHATKASSHFVIGLEGEIVQCIPCNEISYASNDRNWDTVSIECCIEDDTGEFNEATYASVSHLTAWLMERYQLGITDVIRHYDVTGKECPKYYVDNPAAWEQLLADVKAYYDQYCK